MIAPVQGVGAFPGSNAIRSIYPVLPPPTPQVGTVEAPRRADQVTVNPTHEPSSTAQDDRTRQVVKGITDTPATQSAETRQRNVQAQAMSAFRHALMPTVPQIASNSSSTNQQGNDPSGDQGSQGRRQTGLFARLGAAQDPRYRWSGGGLAAG